MAEKYIQKTNFFKFVFLIIILIGLSSCSSPENSSSGQNWRTGSEGISIRFAPDSPPNEVLSSEDLNVIVEYANKGSYNIGKGDIMFYLTGYDPAILFGRPVEAKSNNKAMEGKSQFNKQGSQPDFVKWATGIDMSHIPNVDSFKQDIKVTSCYKYKTIATPEVCIDPNKISTQPSECSFSVRNLGGSQGAPIAVTDVQVKTNGRKAYFEIHFQNKGRGKPYTGAGLGNCYNSIGLDNIDTINLEKVYLSGDFTASCHPSKKIRLANGRGFVICERPINEKSHFVGVMEIVVSYNYMDSITKSLTIVNVGK